MTAIKWIGPDDMLAVGQTGFLIEKTHSIDGWTLFELRDLPAHTNVARMPKLHGWCGSWNDVSTYGRGVWRVERVARNGRALVRELEGDHLTAALEELGYPDIS